MAGPLNNTPDHEIADEFGSLKELEKELEKRMAVLREEILARKVDVLPGHQYTITVARMVRATIDKDKVLAEMGQEWWDTRTKTSNVEQVTARKRAEVA